MEALFSLLSCLLIFCGFFGVVMSRTYLICLFLCLEVVVMGVFCLIFCVSFYSEGFGGDSFLCLSLLAVKACEASGGLALTVSFSRSHGKTLLSSGSLLMS